MYVMYPARDNLSSSKWLTWLFDAETAGTEAGREAGSRSRGTVVLAVPPVDPDVGTWLVGGDKRRVRPSVPRPGVLLRVCGSSCVGDLELFTPARRV